MTRTRLAFVGVSLMTVMLFTGMVFSSRETKNELYRALGNLAEVVHLVRTDYVDPIDTKALALALDAGIVESVDRTAAVLPADEVDAYEKLVDEPPPFGIVLGVRLSSAAARQVLAASPADTSGLKQGEVIEQVDGVYTRGRPLWQLRLELKDRAAHGETVHLTVLDREVEKRREVDLEPSQWSPRVAEVEQRDGVRVLRILALPQGSVAELRPLLAPPGPLVVDLRELGWGLEDEAIQAADLFTDEGLLGGWKGGRAGSQTYAATTGATVDDPPVVMVGADTEGVGEILAAALRRAGAEVVGTRTAGHAPHMRMIRDSDINLWIPVGEWLRADGEVIDGQGIEPDEVVEPGSEGEDPMLDRALEILREQQSTHERQAA